MMHYRLRELKKNPSQFSSLFCFPKLLANQQQNTDEFILNGSISCVHSLGKTEPDASIFRLFVFWGPQDTTETVLLATQLLLLCPSRDTISPPLILVYPVTK